MKTRPALAIFIAVILGVCSFSVDAFPAGDHESVWRKLDQGLHIATFEVPIRSPVCRYPVTVLRIDPGTYQLKLISASEHGGKSRPPKAWADQLGLVAAINASMFAADHKTSTGFMKNFRNINNPHINIRFGAFLVFNPVAGSLPLVQIVDRYHQNWKALIGKYQTVIQNYRMIGLKGENLWKPSEEMYSIAAVAMDESGHVLFIHSRTPFSVHGFNRFLLALPIDIKNAMYVEGGPEATLYINAGEEELQWTGTHETRFTENGNHSMLWEVPNIIGVQKRNNRHR